MSTAVSYSACHPFTQSVAIHDGLKLVVQKSPAGSMPPLRVDSREMIIEVGFNLGGLITCRFDGGSRNNKAECVPGQAYVSMYHGSSGLLEYHDKKQMCFIGLFLSLENFKKFFDLPEFDLDSRAIAYAQDGTAYKLPCPITPGIRVALQQILNCPFDGKTRELFFESKILELVSYLRHDAQSSASSSFSSGPARLHLTVGDQEKMWKAKAILDANLENPPSILELARLVGVNEFKLKNGFRQVHGTTPYKYLSDQRLEMARSLLSERRMNVTEAAVAVGYSSLSHFAKIFREKFGVNPHEYMSESDKPAFSCPSLPLNMSELGAVASARGCF